MRKVAESFKSPPHGLKPSAIYLHYSNSPNSYLRGKDYVLYKCP